jgi:NADP-dependent 3-hydroxy acid dehydrogenase YdfG
MLGRLKTLKQETVLVTGASWGYRAQVGQVFCREGCRLILLGRKRQAIQALADEQAMRCTERA